MDLYKCPKEVFIVNIKGVFIDAYKAVFLNAMKEFLY